MRFTLDGKRYYRSTRLSAEKVDTDVALRKAYEIMLEVEQDLRLGVQKSEIQRLDAFEKRYLEYAEVNKKPSTFKRDKNRLHRLVGIFGRLRLDEITQERFERYMQERRRDGAGPGTVNHDLKLLRHVLNKACDWKKLADNPLTKIRLLKEPPPGSTGMCLSYEQECRLLEECRRSRNLVLESFVLTALYTALRMSELYNLMWDDVDLIEGLITVRESKNNQTRVIAIHDKVLPALCELQNRYPYASYVFCRPDGRPYRDLSESFENAARRAGLRTEKVHFRLYDCRHTALSRLGMSGCNVFEMAAVSGHKTPNVLRRYTHISAEHKREIINRIGAKVVQQESRESPKLISDVDK